MQTIHLKDLLEAGCHFGHQVNRWHPKAKPYIYQSRDGIHIIDLVKTKEGLEKAIQFVYDVGKRGGTILFVATKRQAKAIVTEEAKRVGEAAEAEPGDQGSQRQQHEQHVHQPSHDQRAVLEHQERDHQHEIGEKVGDEASRAIRERRERHVRPPEEEDQ